MDIFNSEQYISKIYEMSSASNESTKINKMEQWHKGQRRQNVKACSDEKLKAYYMICLDKGYVMEANAIYKEIVSRDIQDDVPEMMFKKVDGKLDADSVCKYIENHVNNIGDDGEDLFKTVDGNKIYYSWGFDKRLPASMNYDCMIDKDNMTMKMYASDTSSISLNNTLNVINTINDTLFGS